MRVGPAYSALIARLNTLGETLLDAIRSAPGGSLLLRIAGDVARGDITDRAMTLAGQAFTSVLPLVILWTTISGSSALDTLLSGLGMSSKDVDVPDSVTDLPASSFSAFGVLGALMVIGGATSLARAIGRMYVSIWQIRKLPYSGWWRWVVVIFIFPAAVSVQVFAAKLHNVSTALFGLVGLAVEIVATLLLWVAVWFAVPRLMVSRQLPLRIVTINAVVTGVAITIYLIGSYFFAPRAAATTTHHYGTLGLVFVAISWLFIFAAIVIVSTIMVRAAAVDDSAIGRWVTCGAPLPEPAPAKPLFFEA